VCCEQPVPEQDNACDNTESLTNPASCTETGTTVTHTLTIMEVAPDCNLGYDLDDCDGSTCFGGGLAPSDGTAGVDNAVSGLAPTLEGVGGNLSGVNQALSDTICGSTDDPEAGTCDGGDNDGDACAADEDCPGGECTLDDDDCMGPSVPPADIRFAVDANTEEGCANVTITSGDSAPTDVILNLSDDGCASGVLGTIPVKIGDVEGEFTNANVRMTVSDMGFTDGVLGVTIDEATASAIADALIEGGSGVVGQVLDINVNLTQDTSAACNALSGTLLIGGYAEEGGAGGGGGNGGNGGGGGGNGQ
jgi:hypothetical protein